MATYVWTGDAPAVAQVDTVQVTAYDAATTYTLTINGKSISVPGNTSVNQTASDLADEWNNSTIPEFAEVTASVSTDTVTLTADTAGVPYTATSSKSGGTGTIGSVTSSTANDGPNVWGANNFKNTSTAARALPGGSDTVIFEDSSVDCKYGLDQSSAGELTALHIEAGYTGEIGLARTNSDGGTEYNEYRDRYLKINATNIYIGEGSGGGSGRLQIDCDNTSATTTGVDVITSASAAESNRHAVQVQGGATISLTIHGGTVDIAPEAGSSVVIDDVTASGTSEVRCAADAVGVLTASGSATVDCDQNITTLTMTDGPTVTLRESATITTANVNGGTLNHESSGTVTTMNIGSNGAVDRSGSQKSCTFTNTTMAKGATLDDSNALVTFTNDIDLGLTGLEDVTLRVGIGRNIGVS